MSDERPLAIRLWSNQNENRQDISSMLLQIIQQKGEFLHVTEESLEEEIRNGELQAQDDQSSAEKEEGQKPKGEDMQSARIHIGKFAAQAFNESAQALDLISLLLTKYTSAAESSVSPFIRQNIPFKTLAAEPTEPHPVSEAKRQHDQLVCTGWKLQALNTAADSLLNSATKLEDEMKKEAKYWNQVLAVKEKGWTVARMPRDHHTLGVHFGFLESPPEFRDKSMAALKREEVEGANLDLGTDFPGKKMLRARVVRGDETVATSADNPDKMEDDTIESAILRARNNIFDAELFSDLLRESRELSPRGVQWSNSRVVIPFETDTTLVIELGEPISSHHRISAGGTKYDVLPSLALTMLRILLGHSHTQHYKQRTESVPIIGDKPRARKTPVLLRPFLSYLHHLRAQEHLVAQLRRFKDTLRGAGLHATLSNPRTRLDARHLLESTTLRDSKTLVNVLLSNLTQDPEASLPMQVVFEINGESKSKTTCEIAISIRTHSTGSEYKIMLTGNGHLEDLKVLYRETSFTEPEKAMAETVSLVRAYIVRQYAAKSAGKMKITGHGYPRLFAEAPEDNMFKIDLDLSMDHLRLSWPSAGVNGILSREWTAQSPAQHMVDDGLAATVSHVLSDLAYVALS